MDAARKPHATLRLVLFIAIVLAGVGVLRTGIAGIAISTATFEEWLTSAGWWAPVIYIIGCAILTNFMVPISLQVIAAGLVFGWPDAFLYSLPAGVAGHLLGYGVSAWLAREAVGNLLERSGYSGVLARIEEASALRVAFVARFVPVPVGVQNYTLGLARLPLLPYLAGSLAGALPWFFVFTQLGASAGTHLRASSLIGPVVFVILAVIVDRWWDHQTRNRSENVPHP